MCGIVGIIDSSLDQERGESLLKRMLESIKHRGPDNSSWWTDMPVLLGHNRLSIIDLSDDANQPMAFDDLVIVYNGEVYNYLEIKTELTEKGYLFRTTSDTEVILAAYQEWGADCVKRFVGMWAFAIWDKKKKELFCSRDRFGIKPLYYIHAGSRFYFGSEYKPLKLSPVFDNAFNHRQISRGLLHEMVSYRDETYFDCLKILSERSNLVFKDGRVTVTEYWDVDSSKKFQGTFEDKKTRFLELFRDSVKLHLRSDVEVGGCLSGGLDSSSIASVVGKDHASRPFKTFTIYYQGENAMDERRWVAELGKAYSNIESLYYCPPDDEVATSFDEAITLHDVPMPMSPPLSYYLVMKFASQHGIKVMLDGQGSDEYLGGYSPSFDRLIHWSSLGFDDQDPELDGKRIDGSRLKQYLYHLMFYNPLPFLLHSGDRMSMGFSIESRVPFLDHRLIEFVHSLEDSDIIHLGKTKYILRNSLQDFLPEAIASRIKKQPFFGGEGVAWLRGPLKYLSDLDFAFDRLSLLNPVQINDLLEKFKRGDNSQAGLIWKLVNLNYWALKQ
jgi:asparagine synthase (glutamine-hydrolysing)